MKQNLFIGFLVLINSITFAQNGSLTGTVADKNGTLLELVNVAVRDSAIGAVTNQNGVYKIENLREGSYTIVASSVGYSRQAKQVQIKEGMQVNLDFELHENASELQEILIVSKVGATEIKPQKITYTASELPSQAGGSAGDVLKNMPSVAMGGSPNHNRDIRYRGLGNAYTNVLINGRNAGATGNNRETVLDMIPASQIERIEIFSNPSADVQSDGINGVVNIVLKKGTPTPGPAGSVSFIVDNQQGYNGSAQLVQSWEKVQISAGIDQLKRSADKTESEKITKFNDDGSVKETSDAWKNEIKSFQNTGARVKLNYSPTNDFNFSAEYLYGHQNESKETDELNLSYNSAGEFKKGTIRLETEDKGFGFHNWIFQSNLKLGKNASVEATFNTNFSEEEKNKFRNDYKTDSEGIAQVLDSPKRQSEYEIKAKDAYFPAISYQYRKNAFQVKGGYQGFLTAFNSEKTVSNFNFSENRFVASPDNKNNFLVQENIHAFYGLFKWGKNQWNIEGGLRYEVADVASESSADSIPKGEGDYQLPLPNLNIQYQIDEKSYLTFSWGRRVRRPAFQDLNPFVEIKNLNEIKRGNPSLQPEDAWAYEVGYLRKFKKFDIGVNGFYRDINNLIQKNKYELADGFIVEEPVNLNGAKVYGAEFLSNVQPAEWWSLNINYSRFFSEIKDKDSDFDGDALKDQTDWTGKIISDFSLPANFTLQLAGNVVGPKVSSQKTEETIWSVDAGLQRTILQNGILVLRIIDIFNTLGKTKIETTGTQLSEQIENTPGQIISAGLKWNF